MIFQPLWSEASFNIGVHIVDIVPSGVAALADLQLRGYAYIHLQEPASKLAGQTNVEAMLADRNRDGLAARTEALRSSSSLKEEIERFLSEVAAA